MNHLTHLMLEPNLPFFSFLAPILLCEGLDIGNDMGLGLAAQWTYEVSDAGL